VPARKYTEAEFAEAVRTSTTIAGLLKAVGLRPAGGNYASAKQTIQRLGLDASHFVGQAWSRDQQLRDWSGYTRASRLRGHLARERGERCEACGGVDWQGQPIPLEVHHVDGDRTHNALVNLRLLCPNCHAQTDTWRNRTRPA
jgi:hypothetical protein